VWREGPSFSFRPARNSIIVTGARLRTSSDVGKKSPRPGLDLFWMSPGPSRREFSRRTGRRYWLAAGRVWRASMLLAAQTMPWSASGDRTWNVILTTLSRLVYFLYGPIAICGASTENTLCMRFISLLCCRATGEHVADTIVIAIKCSDTSVVLCLWNLQASKGRLVYSSATTE
jgi:hypothetical protein